MEEVTVERYRRYLECIIADLNRHNEMTKEEIADYCIKEIGMTKYDWFILTDHIKFHKYDNN